MASSSKNAKKDLATTLSEESVLTTKGYKLIKRLGEGSYAKVYMAEYRPPDQEKTMLLACKIIDTEKATKDFVEKFLPREMEILIKINHPYIVYVHNIFLRKKKYFIFMRYAENGDLLEYLLKNGSIKEKQARIWLRQLALALQYLHEMDIAHRDIKCENVLVTANNNLKLSDFGFSRMCVDANNRNVLSATYCGSISYAAPEIIRGRPYGPKACDIWSLGVVLYVMLNKVLPFDDKNTKKLLEHQIHKKWNFRSKVADTISSECKSLVRSMLEPDCIVRYKIDRVLKSSWIAMDERLTTTRSTELSTLKERKTDNNASEVVSNTECNE